jgi:hypothetical protein
VDQQEKSIKKEEGKKLLANAFYWAWSHNILQIKGNHVAYQTKRLMQGWVEE